MSIKEEKKIKFSTHLKYIGKLEAKLEILNKVIKVYERHEQNFNHLVYIERELKDEYKDVVRRRCSDLDVLYGRIAELTNFCLETFRIAEDIQRNIKAFLEKDKVNNTLE
jgi:hypothetical protein